MCISEHKTSTAHISARVLWFQFQACRLSPHFNESNRLKCMNYVQHGFNHAIYFTEPSQQQLHSCICTRAVATACGPLCSQSAINSNRPWGRWHGSNSHSSM